MARITKIELEQMLSERNATIEQLRHRVSVLEGTLALQQRPAQTVPVQRAAERIVGRYTDRFGRTFDKVCSGNSRVVTLREVRS